MSEFTLPGRSRKRHALDPREALIPVATGTRTTTAAATHLTDDRNAEPSFDDLIAGNRREPNHQDLLAMNDEPIEQPRPKRYPGVSTEAMAYLRAQDAVEDHPNHDRHAYDVDHLAPTPLCTVDLTQLDTDEASPTMPAVGNPQLLFGALDALDRLPGLYAVDAKSFEMAASIAAIQTYAALRPDLLGRHEMHMELAPLAAQLAEPDAEPSNHTGQLAAAWTSIREAHTRFAADGFLPDHRFETALTLDALDEAIGELIDGLGDVRGVFDAEADDIELLAIEAGLPMRQDDDEEPLADWERELLALPEGETDPATQRAFADMDAMDDAVDAWYAEQATASFAPGLRVVHNATGAAGTVVKIALGRALVRLDRAPEGLTPFSFFDLSPEAEPVQFVEHVDHTETKAEIRDLMDLDGAASWGQL